MAQTLEMSEKDLRRAILCGRKADVAIDGALITDCPGECLAHFLGWGGMYAGPLQTTHGWRTPTRGDLGEGWPDLVLVKLRGRHRRLVFAELKTADGQLEPAQRAVIAELSAAGQEVYVWRPADLDSLHIARILQEGP